VRLAWAVFKAKEVQKSQLRQLRNFEFCGMVSVSLLNSRKTPISTPESVLNARF
jgi:hypothetical protein